MNEPPCISLHQHYQKIPEPPAAAQPQHRAGRLGPIPTSEDATSPGATCAAVKHQKQQVERQAALRSCKKGLNTSPRLLQTTCTGYQHCSILKCALRGSLHCGDKQQAQHSLVCQELPGARPARQPTSPRARLHEKGTFTQSFVKSRTPEGRQKPCALPKEGVSLARLRPSSDGPQETLGTCSACRMHIASTSGVEEGE